MENNIYAKAGCVGFPYIIIVKRFYSGVLCLPGENVCAYSYPNTGSKIIYIFDTPQWTTDRYPITQLVFCSYDYWVKISDMGEKREEGYVKCSDIGFDYKSYVDPARQTPNPQIGSNTEVIFNMWYFPNSQYRGVNYATPLYYQYYNNGTNSLKCTLLSSISGLYKYKGLNYDPTTYLKEMTARYWSSEGINTWLASMGITATQDDIRKIAKKNLNQQKPILVGARSNSFDHMVLVVGYKNCGNDLSDYLVLDSVQEKFSTLKDFFDKFPKYPTDWSISGGYVYGEY